jgi:PilZ domain
MTTASGRVERRARQRFEFSIPLCIRRPESASEEQGCTQDVSARGAYFYTSSPLQPGTDVDVTFLMPAEITLSESMHVRCRGKVLRVDSAGQRACNNGMPAASWGVAVHFESYEYLANAEQTRTGEYQRVAALHDSRERVIEDPFWPPGKP